MIVYRVGTVTLGDIKSKDAGEKIGDMWNLSRELLLDHDGPIYSIHYNFKDGDKKEFDYAIGSSLKLKDRNPVKFDIGKYDYKVFEKSFVREKGLVGAWENIWEMEENGQINRAYGIDYEKYDTDGEIEIYVSINK